jgi:hypothetical protein
MRVSQFNSGFRQLLLLNVALNQFPRLMDSFHILQIVSGRTWVIEELMAHQLHNFDPIWVLVSLFVMISSRRLREEFMAMSRPILIDSWTQHIERKESELELPDETQNEKSIWGDGCDT